MLIGITGGIGSGKSTISAGLCALGYPVYDTDSRAKAIIVTDPSVRMAVQRLFGPQVITGTRYDTAHVAAAVFAHPGLLDELNAVVHPAVFADLNNWYHHLAPGTIALVESAILYSSHLSERCDAVLFVDAPQDVRVHRVMDRDAVSYDTALARVRTQHHDSDRLRADWVVNNDGKEEISALCLHIQDIFRTFATSFGF